LYFVVATVFMVN